MTPLLPAALAALALASAQASDPKPRPRPSQQKAAPDGAKKARLSAEDEALVKDLALVEKVDLLHDLELFEEKEHGGGAKSPPERRQ